MGVPKEQILPYNKQRQLAHINLTEDATTEFRVSLEQAAALITLHVVSASGSISVRIYDAGDNTRDKILVGQFPSIRSDSDPIQLAVPTGGTLLFVVDTMGSIEATIRGKGIDHIVDQLNITDVNELKEKKSNELSVFRDEVVAELNCLNKTMLQILNHMRYMTDIRSDDGEDF